MISPPRPITKPTDDREREDERRERDRDRRRQRDERLAAGAAGPAVIATAPRR